MKLSEFDFDLPPDQIARHPTERRHESRLMVVRREDGAVEHRRFEELPGLLRPKDLLVVNDSKVLRARLFGKKVGTGGRVELLLVEPEPPKADRRWRALANASKPLRPGTTIELVPGVEVAIVAREEEGFVVVDLPDDAVHLTETHGHLPLPPYLGRNAEPDDLVRYQTVYARDEAAGSVAAPTAGLHFSEELLRELAAKGIERAAVTLHVGPGTFLPVRTDDVEAHRMHAERFEVTDAAARQIEAARSKGGRVVAVGTTATRVLEAVGRPTRTHRGSTALFIRPGYHFSSVDALLTNFHLPRSTLLMLISAFAGHELIMRAYRAAVSAGYRFFSYGDAMLIV